MKKVFLLGDSIRLGYDKFVRELLEGTAEVFYSDDNGRFAGYTYIGIPQWKNLAGNPDEVNVVHWNNGYWDMNIEAPMEEAMHPVDEYVHFLRRILGEIRRNGAVPVFATTTPILSAGAAADITGTGADSINYNNDWVQQYNQAAVQLMEEEKVIVNDLYALCAQDPHAYKCEDLLHLTEEGYQKCAAQTADLIRSILG